MPERSARVANTLCAIAVSQRRGCRDRRLANPPRSGHLAAHARKPATRDEAIALAHMQYAYCNDIVDQGTESISRLAAELMAHDWWFFWWD